jgi:hypothetical protein
MVDRGRKIWKVDAEGRNAREVLYEYWNEQGVGAITRKAIESMCQPFDVTEAYYHKLKKEYIKENIPKGEAEENKIEKVLDAAYDQMVKGKDLKNFKIWLEAKGILKPEEKEELSAGDLNTAALKLKEALLESYKEVGYCPICKRIKGEIKEIEIEEEIEEEAIV